MKKVIMNLTELDFLDELIKDIKIQLDLGNYKKAKILSEIYMNIRGDKNECNN